jgi:hypothetical protein
LQNPKSGHTRLNPEQKAVLDAEVENNGPYPDVERRLNLARQLGLKEKSVKVLTYQLPWIS